MGMAPASPDAPLPRVVIAGTGSGVGKTSVTCAVIGGLAKMGHTVQPFKAGPDYIDPGYLSAAAGREACNLDSWIMGRDGVAESFARNSRSDVSVIEGVMGLYDGIDGSRDLASTHHIARITGSPVILVVDARGAARSVAATVLGFARFRRGSPIKGVILNMVGSSRHESMCRDALEPLGIPVLGAVPRAKNHTFQSRHLGLVPAAEDQDIARRVAASSRMMMDHIDMEGVRRLAASAGPLKRYPEPRCRKEAAAIGVAMDASFNFYYRDNLEILRRTGARLEFFSPESGSLPSGLDGLYMGGGFPEVRAGILEGNHNMMRDIRGLIQDGAPTYAECGGLMYLAKSLRRGERKFRMAGLLDAETTMTGKAVLNYTRGKMCACTISPRPAKFRGHEFHYSRMEGVPPDTRFAQTLDVGLGIDGGRDGIMAHGATASYGHLYLTESAAAGMVGRCVTFSRR